MVKSKIRQRIWVFVSAIIAVFLALGAFVAATPMFGDEGNAIPAQAEGRITMLDLYNRYPIDWVIGPLAQKATSLEGIAGIDAAEIKTKDNGDRYYEDIAANVYYEEVKQGDSVLRIVDRQNNIVYLDNANAVAKDLDGKTTNNVYQIPRGRFFNVESYIYTTTYTVGDKTERVLHGWKPGIVGIARKATDTFTAIDENGLNDKGQVAMYYEYGESSWYLTKGNKYALIVPDDVTRIGQGNGAYVTVAEDGTKTAHYNSIQGNGPETTSTKTFNSSFTDFGAFLSINDRDSQTPNMWQPRERLIGVYFNETSKLTSIAGGSNTVTFNGSVTTDKDGGYDKDRVGNAFGGNRSKINNAVGKSAFADCDNIRFFIMPSENASKGIPGVTSIGNDAFYGDMQLVDVNIPSSVKSLGGNAFAGCSSLLHISIPEIPADGIGSNVFEGCKKLKDVSVPASIDDKFSFLEAVIFNKATDDSKSKLYVIGGTKGDNGVNGFFLCQNNTGKALSGLTSSHNYENGSWYALGLSGKTDSDGKTVYYFPDKISDDSPYRNGIAYDFINSDGLKVRNSIESVIDRYDVAAEFAKNTWCSNIVMSKAVHIIGTSAFEGSHVRYMETYAAVFGSKSFGGKANSDDSIVNGNHQWYYFHKNEEGKYDVPSDAFTNATNTRYLIFDDKASRDNAPANMKKAPAELLYLIPVTAHIESEDGTNVKIAGSDIDDRFYNDSDYDKLYNFAKNGDGCSITYTYTKRLSGSSFGFDYVKQLNGHWVNSSEVTATVEAHKNPVLDNMTSTKWYSSDGYTAVTTADNGYNTNTTTRVDIYTRYIAAPTADGQSFTAENQPTVNYTFGGEEVGEDKSLDFLTALKLDNNVFDAANNINRYKIVNDFDGDKTNSVSFVYASGGNYGMKVENVQNAGTYTMHVALDPHWGEWSNEYAAKFVGKVTVDTCKVTIENIDEIPEFEAELPNGTVTDLKGNSNTLYRYDNSWYLTRQGGKDEITSVSVTNGYIYTASAVGGNVDITIRPKLAKDTVYSAEATRGQSYASASGEYYAYFTFKMPIISGTQNESNYEFLYNGTDTLNDHERGIMYDKSKASRLSLEIRKRWYIVTKTNMFVDSEATDITDDTPTFVLATGADGKTKLTWGYDEFDGITVHNPKLAYTDENSDAAPTAVISFKPYGSADTYKIGEIDFAEAGHKTFEHYFNFAMPAGTYTVELNGEEADVGDDKYEAISDVIVIEVTPAEFDATAIGDLAAAFVENGAPKTFEFAYKENTVQLHGDVSELLGALNDSLNKNMTSGVGDKGFWASETPVDGISLYDSEVTMSYNLNRFGNDIYYTVTELSQPSAVDEYIVFYKVSAKNYVSYGGAGIGDAARDDYSFKTLIYKNIKVSDLLAAGDYFEDVTYTGFAAQTRVPQSTDFEYAFTDAEGYVNCRDNATVTLALKDTRLARWDLTGVDGVKYALTDAGDPSSPLVVTYAIKAADNGWNVQPQMPGWSYNGFDKNKNTVAAGLKFTNAGITIYYRIGRQITNSDSSVSYEWVDVGGTIAAVPEADRKYYFAVNAAGEVTDNAVIGILKGLDAGDYYLASYVTESSDGNVNAYEPDTYSRVVVGQAVNTWTSSPNVIRWTWGDYSKTVNLITAVAEYNTVGLADGETAPVVTYTLLDGEFAKINDALTNFVAPNGVVDEDVATALKALPAGKYYLVTSLEERQNYTAINPRAIYAYDEDGNIVTADGDPVRYDFADAVLNAKLNPVGFDIALASNSWTREPSMTSWAYNSFAASTNFVAGTPRFPESGAVVTYGVKTTPFGSDVVKPVKAEGDDYVVVFTEMTDSVAATLKALPAATAYYFIAWVDGAENMYGDLYVTSSFGVSRVSSNSWKDGKEPTISGWTFGEFNADLVTAGEPVFGDPAKTTFTVEKELGENQYESIPEHDDLAFDALKQKLGDLGAGTYKLTVTSEGGDDKDFAPAIRELRFTVAQAENAWATDNEPSIEGWTYGENSNAPEMGLVDFDAENTVITVEYYRAVLVGGNWVATGDALEKSGDKLGVPSADEKYSAGDYVAVFTAENPDGGNYKKLVKNVYFAIEKVGNDWGTDAADKKLEPETSLEWKWGEAETYLADKIFVNATDKNNAVPTYVIRNISGGSYSETFTDRTALETALHELGVGTYEAVVYVAASANYTAVSKTCQIVVNPATFVWAEDKEPTNGGWKYGDTDKTVFAEPSVVTVLETDTATVKYTVVAKSGTESVTTKYDSYADMSAAVLALGAGTHEITVTVENPNYNTLEKTVTVTVTPATYTWKDVEGATLPNSSWLWNDKWTAADGGREIVHPIAVYSDGSEVEATLKIGETVYTYAELVEYLQGNIDAGSYVVSVTVEQPNRESISTSFTVTVGAAKNNWKEGHSPKQTIDKVYKENITVADLGDVQAEFGTVIFNYKNKDYASDVESEMEELLAAINDSAQGTYTLTVRVDGEDKHFEGIAAYSTSVNVAGIGGAWDNAGDLSPTVNFTYSSTLETDMAAVAIPVKTPEAGLENPKCTYTVTYTAVGASGGSGITLDATTIGEWISKVKEIVLRSDSLLAGTYVIEAAYDPNDSNYAKLEYTVTISVAKATVSWIESTKPLSTYAEEYESFKGVPTPKVTDTTGKSDVHTVTYTVNGEDTVITDLAAYLNGLPVGRYTIAYGLASTDNYTGLDRETFTVDIRKANNDWKNGNVLTALMNVNRGDAFGFTMPEAQFGTVNVTLTMLDGKTKSSPPADTDINDWLASLNLPAGDGYKVSFTVAGTDNYGKLLYDTTLNIKLNANKWTTPPVSGYTWTGTNRTFAKPVAEVNSITVGEDTVDLLRFDIVAVGDGYVAKSGLTWDEFQNEIKMLPSGTFTVTSRIGGKVKDSENASVKKAFEAYNSDYAYVVGTTTIAIDRSGNNFSVTLSGKNWTYKDVVAAAAGEGVKVVIEKPIADNGGNYIVYTVVGTKLDGDDVKITVDPKNCEGDTDEEKAINAFAKFIEELNKLEAGTYTVTANIPQSEEYGAAVTSAVYTVGKITTAWNKTDAELNAFNGKTATYGSADSVLNTLYPTDLALANRVGATVVYSFDGKVLVNDPSTPMIDEGTWLYALMNCDAGMHTLTAFVASDNNYTALSLTITITIEAAPLSWKNQDKLQDNAEWIWHDAGNTELVAPELSGWKDAEGGDVVYMLTDNGNNGALLPVDGENFETTDWNKVIAALKNQRAGTYTVKASVTDPKGNHTSVSHAIRVVVGKVVTAWSNDDLPTELGWTYGDKTHDKLPTLRLENRDEADLGKIKYSYKTSPNGESTTLVSDWNSFINGEHAGTYYFTAFLEGDENHTDLTYEVRVTIAQVVTAWKGYTEEQLESMKSLSWSFGGTAKTLPTLELANRPSDDIVFTVTYNGGTPVTISSDWNGYIAGKPQGTYVFTATVIGNTDYTALSYTSTVVIGGFTVEWTNQADLTEYGNSVTFDYGAATDLPVPATNWEEGTVVFAIDGKEIELKEGEDWNKALVGIDNGTYVLTATVKGDDSHNDLTYAISVTIKPITLAWKTGTTQGNAAWTYIDGEKNYPALVMPELVGWDQSNVVYTIVDGDNRPVNIVGTSDGWANVVGTLKTQNNGAYTVTAAVADPKGNHTSLTHSFTVTINPAPTSWSNLTDLDENKNLVWTWGESATNTAPTKPVLDGWAQENVNYTITNSKNSTFELEPATAGADDAKWSQVLNTLAGLDCDTYTIAASVADASGNHTSLTYEMTVRIDKAVTAWVDADKLATELSWNYGDDPDKLPALDIANWFVASETDPTLNAKLDDIEYYYRKSLTAGETQLTEDWNTFIGKQPAGTYYFRAFLKGDVNHTDLAYNLRVTIGGHQTAWKNQDALTACGTSVSWNYGATPVVIPMPVPNWTTTVTYYLDGVAIAIADGEDWNKALDGKGHGTYVLSAVAAGDGSHEELTWEVTVAINVVPTSWKDGTLQGDVTWTYIDDAAKNYPALKMPELVGWAQSNVVYTVVTAGGVSIKLDGDEISTDDWNKVLAALHAQNHGAYTVTASASDAAGNYESRTHSFTVTINPLATVWENNDELVKNENRTWDYGFEPDLPVPQANWNATVAYYLVTDTTETLITSGTWNDELAGKPVGSYKVKAVVTDPLGNHTAKEFVINVTIDKVAVTWSGVSKDAYTWTWDPEKGYTDLPAAAIPSWDKAPATLVYTLTQVGASGTIISDGDFTVVRDKLKEQGIGTYTLTATVVADGNHTAAPNVQTVVINPARNDWAVKPNNPAIVWVYGSAENDAIVFEPQNNKDNAVIRINDKVWKAAEGQTLNDYLATLGKGEYVIEVEVPAVNNYTEISARVTLTVNFAPNEWTTKMAMGNDGVEAADGAVANVGWTWNNGAIKTVFTAPVSAVGETTLTVSKISGEVVEVVISATLRYEVKDGKRVANANDLNAFLARLYALDAGNYKIAAAVAQTDNYEALTSDEILFVVKQAKNSWTTEPIVKSAIFGSNSPVPESAANFGGELVKYSYAPAKVSDPARIDITTAEGKTFADSLTWQDGAPIEAARYYVRGTISATVNYAGLDFATAFNIGAGTNAWVNMPGVIAWNWNDYKREVNLFSGSARNNGTAKFSIYKTGADGQKTTLSADADFVVTNGANITTAQREMLTDFELVEVTVGNSKRMYVSEELAVVLNAIRPGTYILDVHVDGGASLQPLDGTATFVVGKASNGWKDNGSVPNVLSFTYGGFENNYFTAGVATYGTNNVSYKVTGTLLDGTTVVASEVLGSTAAVTAYLNELSAGSYMLSAWATANENDTFMPFYSESSPYLVQFNVTRAENGWAVNKAPAASVSDYYVNIKADDYTLATLKFAAPEAKSGTNVLFEILAGDQSGLNKANIAYANLLDEIKKLGAGSYIIRSSVAQSTDYTAISADTSLEIKRQSNAFTALLEKDGELYTATVEGAWHEGDGNDISKFVKAEATYGSTTISYAFGGTSYAYDDVIAELKNLGAGTYTVSIKLAQTDEYVGLAGTVTVVIKPAANTWQDGWTIQNSVKHKNTVATTWNWSKDTEAVKWVGVKPQHGNIVNVRISRKTEPEKSIHYFTIDTSKEFDRQVAAVGSALSSLGAGSYILTVSAPVGQNWAAIADNTLELTVNQAPDNKWGDGDGNFKPTFVGADDRPLENNTWNYGTSAKPFAKSTYGEYTVDYYVYDGNAQDNKGKRLDQKPTDAGKYVAVFSVDTTLEYGGLIENVVFTINKIEYKDYAVLPGIKSWTWDTYDREVNLFSGSALSQGAVSYDILDADGNVVTVDGVKLEGIKLVDEDGNHNGDPSIDLYVPVASARAGEPTAEFIARLLGGDYVLRVSFDETTNYTSFYQDVPFTIGIAHNNWDVTPSVSPWSVNHWNAEESTPQAMSTYGEPEITIVGVTDNITYYRAKYSIADGKYIAEVNILNSAPAGRYTMTTTVAAEAGKYNSAPDSSFTFQIFVMGSASEKNDWLTYPAISSWKANVDNMFGEIIGSPIRGLPYFEFYTAKIENGVPTLGDLVEAGEDTVTVEKGTKYDRDFVVPMAPGTYFMVGHAVYKAGGGIVEADTLETKPIMFTIGNRDNAFEQDARIDTILYLGEKDSWKLPTAKATLGDSEIEFTYIDAETGEELGNAVPTAPGKYILRATAVAKYSTPIVSEIEFTVALSQNGWVNDKSPTIDSWSEENSDNAPNPVGEAKHGSIVYTYINTLEPEVVLTEKPTAEGTYIMIARVELDGYVTLESTYEFTIEAAFDRDLVTLNIVLGLIACVIAVVVIIFAVRRYKENG